MNKKNIAKISVFFIGIITVFCTYNNSHRKCSNHMIKIGDEICKYRHEHSMWPTTQKELLECGIIPEGEKFETLHGIPIIYNPDDPSISADCPHGKTDAHGVALLSRYEHLYKK